MKRIKALMGMTVTVEIADTNVRENDIADVFGYFTYIDQTFSTYKKDSEISKINRGELVRANYSEDMNAVLKLSDETKKETNGYFDISHNGLLDPSGLVKGWAIYHAAKILSQKGFKNFYVDAGGDVQVFGLNSKGKKWRVGIKNPFNQKEIVKAVCLTDCGIATSGTYIRGQHIYNPRSNEKIEEIVNLTVIGANVYEADRFATAAFAMGRNGISFISTKQGLEGYMIDKNGIATFTKGFEKFIC